MDAIQQQMSAASSSCDATMDDMGRKVRSSRPNKWKPFDFSEPDPCLSEDMDEARHTPLDVHAKPFMPTPPLAHATGGHFPGDYGQDHYHFDQQDDLQLVSGRRHEAGGLNAYQTREASHTPTVTATYDKEEINDVFGDDLPSPSYCQSHPGRENGQIQFCIHPNGDVSAQQWSEGQYQWINVGQYSNIRKRTEGQLASDRLRGETEGQTLQQQTLVYFHAIAKQREATVKGLPFSLEEIRACLPDNAEHADSAPSMDQTSASLASLSSAYPGASDKSSFAIASPEPHRDRTNINPSQQLVYSETPTPATRTLRSHHGSIAGSALDSRLGRLTFGPGSQLSGSPRDENQVAGHGLDTPPLLSRKLPMAYGSRLQSLTLPARERGHSMGYSSGMSATCSDLDDDQTIYSSRRGFRGLFNHLNEDGALLSQSRGSLGRTVMYDPVNRTPSPPALKSITSGPRSFPRDMPAASIYDILRQSQSVNETVDLHDSELDTTQGAHATSSEHGEETVIDKDPFKPLQHHSLWDHEKDHVVGSEKDAELQSWWTFGNKAERHEDFYQRLLQNHANTEALRESMRRGPGVIGPPSRQPVFQPKPISPPRDEGITRLLIPLWENLASYVEGPEHQRHGYWAPFTTPPEWAIDKSLGGNDSFFDEDWGKPPERIGRDQRYRNIGFVAKKGSFATAEGWSPRR